jgi:hypothetical protein
MHSGLFEHFPLDALLEGLTKFEDAARGLPLAIVAPLYR